MSITASPYIENASSEENFTFRSVSRNERIDTNSISLLDWISQNENIYVKDHAVSSLDSKGLKEIHFSLSGKLAGFYPLLRGIAGSGQPQSLLLNANHEERNFTLQFDASSEGEAKKYLSKVLNIIEDEARFKQVLRKVIANQEKFKLEEKLLFKELST
ncbi:MAG: hypothetical protein WD426_17370 [Anditalea sp.]